jgi:SAM-dependent methyltransferase
VKAGLDPERSYWDAVGKEWEAERPHRLWRAHSDAVNGALLERWLPELPEGRVLKTDLFDEAVGGGLHDRLAAKARLVCAIDLSLSTIRRARDRIPGLRGVQADARRLPLADGAFAAAVSNSTLDHFEGHVDLERSLREVRRVLAPGAVFILTLDNPANPLVALRNRLPYRILNTLGLVPYHVGHTVGPWRLRDILEQTGFEVLEIGAVEHCPRVLAVAACRLVERTGPAAQKRFLRALLTFERLGRWPTAPWTGHYVAALARRP